MAGSTGATGRSVPRPRRRFAKGARPFFMEDPDIDRLLAIVTAQAAEISVLRDRLDTHERLAVAGKAPTPENVEAYDAEPEVEDERDAGRAAMLSRVFRILSPDPEEGKADQRYHDLIDELSR